MPIRDFRRIAIWAAFALLAGATFYGFREGRLFAQPVWTPIGSRRFLVFAAAYVAYFTAFSIWRPKLFLPATLCFAILYSLAAAGPVAVLSVALFLLSSIVLGRILLGSDTDGVLALALGISIYMFATSLAALAPINYTAVYLAALITPLVWIRKARLRFQMFEPASRMEHLALGALVFVMLAHWLAALQPEVGADALATHLVVPSTVAMSHKWTFDVNDHLWAVMPMGGDWCYTMVYLPGGEAAAKLLNFSFLGAIVLLLASRGSLMTAALFAATPIVQLVTGSLFVENVWALLTLGALISLAGGRLYLTFILLGAAGATKFGALLFFIPIATLAMLTRPGLRRACAAIGCFLLFAAPPYITAYAKTGNPAFPFLGRDGVRDARFATPLTYHTPYDLTFHTSRFLEGQDGAAGFQWFLLLPAAVLLVGRRWPYLGAAAGVTFAVVGPLVLEASSNLRYLYPALPFATLFIASALAALKSMNGRLYKAALALAGAAFCLDVYFLPSSGWYHKDFELNAISSRARAERITRNAPVRDLVEYLNQAHRGASAAFFETNAIARLRGRALTDTWHTRAFSQRLAAAQTEQECLRLMREHRTNFVVAPAPDSGVPIKTIAVEVFLRNCTEPERRAGNFFAGRLRGDGCHDDQPRPPASAGTYDDIDRGVVYSGGWTRGRFPKAARGTVTFTNAAGASFRFTFSGTEVTYIYSRAFNRGAAEVLIDGVSRGTVDLYSASIVWQSATRFPCSGAGPHTLEVRNTGTSFIDLDALEVR